MIPISRLSIDEIGLFTVAGRNRDKGIPISPLLFSVLNQVVNRSIKWNYLQVGEKSGRRNTDLPTVVQCRFQLSSEWTDQIELSTDGGEIETKETPRIDRRVVPRSSIASIRAFLSFVSRRTVSSN